MHAPSPHPPTLACGEAYLGGRDLCTPRSLHPRPDRLKPLRLRKEKAISIPFYVSTEHNPLSQQTGSTQARGLAERILTISQLPYRLRLYPQLIIRICGNYLELAGQDLLTVLY